MKIGYLMQKGVDVRKQPFNGPAIHVRHVIEELEQLGHQVRLIVGLDGQIWRSDDIDTFSPVTVARADAGAYRLFERTVRRIQTELKVPYTAMFDSVRFAMASKQELQGFDLLLERKSWMAYGGVLAARWLDIPLVLEENGDSLADLEAKGEAPQGLQRRVALTVMGTALRQADHVVATGDGWRDNFIQRWSVDPEGVTTIENGTDLLNLLVRGDLRSFREDDDPDHIPTITYLGGFYAWHGVPNLLRSFARALAFGAQARLLLIGSGAGLGKAQNLVQELGLSDRVTFAGQLSAAEYGPLLADSDIGVSPYCGWMEYSGLKILDYKAAGLPTIASGEGNRPSTVRHLQTGWIIPPCNEDALTEAILYLTADAGLRKRMGRAARIEAEQCHSWRYTVKQLERVFARVLVERNGGETTLRQMKAMSF